MNKNSFLTPKILPTNNLFKIPLIILILITLINKAKLKLKNLLFKIIRSNLIRQEKKKINKLLLKKTIKITKIIKEYQYLLPNLTNYPTFLLLKKTLLIIIIKS
jgi:hypothetical protein